MPREFSSSEEREFDDYRRLGTVEDIRSRLGKLPKVQGEAAEQRKRIEALEKENGELKAKVPEGAVVLTGEDAAAHTAIQASGKTLKEVDNSLKRLAELETEKTGRDRADSIKAAATAEKLDAERTVKALAALKDAESYTFEVGEAADAKGAKAPAGFVVIDGKKHRLAEWAAQEHPYFNLAAGTPATGGAPGREVPPQRGATPPAGAQVKTEDDYRRATESTANYSI